MTETVQKKGQKKPDGTFNDPELIPLIPIIVEQLRMGSVIDAEQVILRQVFGADLWNVIVEESKSNGDADSILNVVNVYLDKIAMSSTTVPADQTTNQSSDGEE